MANLKDLKVPYRDILLSLDRDILLVGGAVRDAVLGRPIKDYDFLSRDAYRVGEEFFRRIGGKLYRLRERGTRRTISVVKDGITFDFSLLSNGLLENLEERDFTVNAVSVRLKDMTVFDPLGGIEDIGRSLLRVCSSRSFDVDPGRILRAFRFVGAYGFLLTKDTVLEIEGKKELLRGLRPERVRFEFYKILTDGNADVSLGTMMDLSVLGVLFPELTPSSGCSQNRFHKYDVWEHTLVAMSSVFKALDVAPFPVEMDDWKLFITRVSLMFHDAGKPYTKVVGEDGEIHFYGHEGKSREIALRASEVMGLSNKERDVLERLVIYHMRPMEMEKRRRRGELTRRELRRFLDRVGDILDLLYIVVASDIIAKGIDIEDDLEGARSLFSFLFDYYQSVYLPKKREPILRGRDLIEMGFEPSPLFGKILSSVEELELSGRITTKEEAKAFVMERWGHLLEEPPKPD